MRGAPDTRIRLAFWNLKQLGFFPSKHIFVPCDNTFDSFEQKKHLPALLFSGQYVVLWICW